MRMKTKRRQKPKNNQPQSSGKLCRIRVDKREAGLRLDIFLTTAMPGLSRKKAKKLVDDKLVSVNGRLEHMASRVLKEKELVEAVVAVEAKKQSIKDISVLYEDDAFLAVDKPPGIPSGPTMDASRLHMEKLASDIKGVKLTLVHRLDKDTSGVLLLAKNKASAMEAAKAFKQRKVGKVYLALAKGATPPSFNSLIHLKEGEAGKMLIVKSGGFRAESSFKTLARSAGYSLVEVTPKTGRTHQIRVQLAVAGHPIIGDSLYGGEARISAGGKTAEIPRHMLHARSLTLFHPGLEKEIDITAPVPDDFIEAAKAAFSGKVPGCLKKKPN